MSTSNSTLTTSTTTTSASSTSLSTTPRSAGSSFTHLAETANGVRMLAKNLARSKLVEWLLNNHPHIVVFVDAKLEKSARFDICDNPKLRYWTKGLAMKHPELFDLVVTLGGDGTVLFASSLFQGIVPPVLAFSLGSLGFLTNFEFNDFKNVLNTCINSGVNANLRMRFTCRVHNNEGKLLAQQQVLNELVVDRGPSPFVTQLELYGDGSLLTVAQADGLIIATPTGSTAYSLSAGGSLVHPGVSAISVTPICPHTLSFRPILLPDGMNLKVKTPNSSRGTAWCSFDGKVRTELKKGYYVTIQASSFPFPTVVSTKTEYFDSVSRNLHWNVRQQQKPLKTEEGEDLENLHISTEVSAPHSGEEEIFDINFDGSFSSTPNSEENLFLPSNGGANTPQNTSYLNNIDERCCFAHPKARIHLNGRE
ncbi:UTR1 NAD(+) kinase [Candida maltosa Xu316]